MDWFSRYRFFGIFLWICYHELVTFGIVRGFILQMTDGFYLNVLELEDTF